MATFTGSPVVPAGLSTDELLAPMAAFDTHQNQLLKQQADTIANAYAPQRNQLFLDTGAIANQFATAKNPLEIQSLRQQLGLDPNPNRDQIMRLFSGDGTGQTTTAGGDSTTETADDLTLRRGGARRPDQARDATGRRHRLRRQRAARKQGQSVHRRGRRGGLARDFSMERRSARGVQGG